MATGVLFGLLVLAHLARLASEGAGPLREPIFLATSLGSVAMAVWAVALLRRGDGQRRGSGPA